MATEIQPETTRLGWKPYHLSVEQFRATIKAGIFPAGSRLELLGGIVVAKATRTDPHNFVVGALGDEIRRVMPSGWVVREEKPITIGQRSLPEPDLAIVRGPRSLYARRPPTQKETGLIVEVAETTYPADRADRWRIYATARIPTYWIVHLPECRFEVHRDPIGRARDASYRVTESFGSEAHVPVIIDGHEVGRFAVKDFLP
jgi:Uma2 family endonuclease